MKKQGQSILEYLVIITLVTLGIIYAGPYVLRSVNAYFHLWDTSIQGSYEERLRQAPENTIVNITSNCEMIVKQGACGGLSGGRCPPGTRELTETLKGDCFGVKEPPQSVSCPSDCKCCQLEKEKCGTTPIPLKYCSSNPKIGCKPPVSSEPIQNGKSLDCYFGQALYETSCDSLTCPTALKPLCKYEDDKSCMPKCQGDPPPLFAATCSNTKEPNLTQNENWKPSPTQPLYKGTQITEQDACPPPGQMNGPKCLYFCPTGLADDNQTCKAAYVVAPVWRLPQTNPGGPTSKCFWKTNMHPPANPPRVSIEFPKCYFNIHYSCFPQSYDNLWRATCGKTCSYIRTDRLFPTAWGKKYETDVGIYQYLASGVCCIQSGGRGCTITCSGVGEDDADEHRVVETQTISDCSTGNPVDNPDHSTGNSLSNQYQTYGFFWAGHYDALNEQVISSKVDYIDDCSPSPDPKAPWDLVYHMCWKDTGWSTNKQYQTRPLEDKNIPIHATRAPFLTYREADGPPTSDWCYKDTSVYVYTAPSIPVGNLNNTIAQDMKTNPLKYQNACMDSETTWFLDDNGTGHAYFAPGRQASPKVTIRGYLYKNPHIAGDGSDGNEIPGTICNVEVRALPNGLTYDDISKKKPPFKG